MTRAGRGRIHCELFILLFKANGRAASVVWMIAGGEVSGKDGRDEGYCMSTMRRSMDAYSRRREGAGE
jgi:hypothetical protein